MLRDNESWKFCLRVTESNNPKQFSLDAILYHFLTWNLLVGCFYHSFYLIYLIRTSLQRMRTFPHILFVNLYCAEMHLIICYLDWLFLILVLLNKRQISLYGKVNMVNTPNNLSTCPPDIFLSNLDVKPEVQNLCKSHRKLFLLGEFHSIVSPLKTKTQRCRQRKMYIEGVCSHLLLPIAQREMCTPQILNTF